MIDFRNFFEFGVGIKKIKWNGDEGIGCCPLPSHNDTNPSFAFNSSTGLNYCHSCGWKGNAYTLAVELNMHNPRQFLTPSTEYSKNPTALHNEANSPLKMENKQRIKVKEMIMIEQKKNHYKSNVKQYSNGIAEWKYDYTGKDDDGRMVYLYPEAIKHHKGKDGKPPYWEGQKDSKGRVIGSHCQIFLEDAVSTFDFTKPIYIYEGEKDALISPLQGVSFSGGATSVPDNLSAIYEFPEINIVYDNDDAGKKGARKVAEKIKRESPNTIVRIAEWDSELPVGYDVFDDTATGFSQFDKAVKNATEFTKADVMIKNNKGVFKIMNAKQIIEKYNKPPKPIVEDLLYEGGVTLIAGTDATNKTWCALQLAKSIASGDDEFLGFKMTGKKIPVLVIQFELSADQLSSRLKKYDLTGTEEHLQFAILTSDDELFTDSWTKVSNSIDELSFVDGVVIIDNLYTSTSADLSTNQDLKPVLQQIDNLKRSTGNTFVLIGHHNKNENADKEPLLTKGIITGGKTLTNYVENVFQLGLSTMGADVRRGKITKTRNSYTDLENVAIRLEWNPETCMLERKGVITNEHLHTIIIENSWELKVLLELSDYLNDVDLFDRERLMSFIQAEFPEQTNDTNYKKATRWLKKMVAFGLITGSSNSYKLNREEISLIELDSLKAK